MCAFANRLPISDPLALQLKTMDRWWFKRNANADSSPEIAIFKPVSAAGTPTSHNIVLCRRGSTIWRELSASPLWVEQKFIESELVYKVYCNGSFPPLIRKFHHLLRAEIIIRALPMLLNTQTDKNKIFGQKESNLTPLETAKIHALAVELRKHYKLSTFGFDVLRHGNYFHVVDLNYFPGPVPGDNFVEFVKTAANAIDKLYSL